MEIPARHPRWAMLARLILLATLVVLWLPGCGAAGLGGGPVNIGLIAPLTGGSGPSGEAIQRGMLLAIDEINQAGGVLGRPLALVARDVQNDPPAGVAALRDLARDQGIVAVFGGSFSPVMLGQLEAVHELKIPLINPWGSVTAITRNGRSPNYVFRVSLSDDTADEFLVRYAVEVVGSRRAAVIADTSAWGDSNVVGLTEWARRLGVGPVGVERFAQGDSNMTQQLERLRAAQPDVLFMVANAPEGAAVVRGLAAIGWKLPVVSHWGISGGLFVERAGGENVEGVRTIQTFSFHDASSPTADRVLRAYHARFGTRRIEEVPAPVGVAHGYDGVHLLALAIERAGSFDGPRVRDALEQIERYAGLVKLYEPPFTAERHDALEAKDYLMAVWRDGRLVPDEHSRLPD